MPEIQETEKPNHFEPIHLIIKTRKEFDYLYGLFELKESDVNKNSYPAFNTYIDADFYKCLDDYNTVHLSGEDNL